MAWPSSARFFPKTSWVRYRPKLKDIESKVDRYFETLPHRCTDYQYQRALAITKKKFSIPKQYPYHINDSIKHYQHPDRSPGLPYTTQGYLCKRDVPPNVIKQYVHNLKYGVYTKCTTPCSSFGKPMVGKTDKFRLVWVYPAHMTYAEGMFAMPLIRYYKQTMSSYALWFKFTKGHRRFLYSHLSEGTEFVGLDWDAFDSRIPAWMIRDAFTIIRSCLDFSRYWQWGAPTDSGTLDTLFDEIVRYFINTPIRMPNGKVRVKHQGIPSGSYFTNLLGSIINYLAVVSILGGCMEQLWVLGDDGLAVIRKSSISLPEIARVARVKFGFLLNVNKSEVGESVSFLGYTIQRRGPPLAKFDKLLAQLLLPANRDRCANDFNVRAKALQLSCFGVGCMEFTLLVESYLNTQPSVDIIPRFRDEIFYKLEMLGLGEWPPLERVMAMV